MEKHFYLTRIFSRDNYINWSKLEEMINTKNKNANKKFDYLYSMHEAFWHFEHYLNEICMKWNKTQEMTDPELFFTAIAFTDAVEKIKDFINLFEGTKLKIDFKGLLMSNISYLTSASLWNKKEDIDWQKTSLKTFGANHGQVNKNFNDPEFGILLLKGIRNKLIHPNSLHHGTIHISGNYTAQGNTINMKFFDFKSSFSNDVEFSLRKNIFIESMLLIQKSCLDHIDIWNKEIDLFGTKHFKSIPNKKAIIEKIDEHKYQSGEYHEFLCDQFDLVYLYKAGEILNNEKIKEFAVEGIYAHNLFIQVYNDNFYKHKFGDFYFKTVYPLYSKFIKDIVGDERCSYAVEKIGYWEDWDAKNWFPKVFEKVDDTIPNGPIKWRIIALCIKDLKWGELLSEIKENISFWEKMTMEERALLNFK